MANTQQIDAREQRFQEQQAQIQREALEDAKNRALAGDKRVYDRLLSSGYNIYENRSGRAVNIERVQQEQQINQQIQQEQQKQESSKQSFAKAYHVRISEQLNFEDESSARKPVKHKRIVGELESIDESNRNVYPRRPTILGRILLAKQPTDESKSPIGVFNVIGEEGTESKLFPKQKDNFNQDISSLDVSPPPPQTGGAIKPEPVPTPEIKVKGAGTKATAGFLAGAGAVIDQFEFDKPLRERSEFNQRVQGALDPVLDFANQIGDFYKASKKQVYGEKGFKVGDEAKSPSNPLGLPIPVEQTPPRSKLVSDIITGTPINIKDPYTQGELIATGGEVIASLFGIKKSIDAGKFFDNRIITSRGRSEAKAVSDIATTDIKQVTGIGRKGEKVTITQKNPRTPNILEEPKGNDEPFTFLLRQGTESAPEKFPAVVIRTNKGKGTTTAFTDIQTAKDITVTKVYSVKIKGKIPKDLEEQLGGGSVNKLYETSDTNFPKIRKIGDTDMFEIKNPSKQQLEILQQATELNAIKPVAVGETISSARLIKYDFSGRRFFKQPTAKTVPQVEVLGSELIFRARPPLSEKGLGSVSVQTKKGSGGSDFKIGIGRSGEPKIFRIQKTKDIDTIKESRSDIGSRTFESELTDPSNRIQGASLSAIEKQFGYGGKGSTKGTQAKQIKPTENQGDDIRSIVREFEKANSKQNVIELDRSISQFAGGVVSYTPKSKDVYGSGEFQIYPQREEQELKIKENQFSFEEVQFGQIQDSDQGFKLNTKVTPKQMQEEQYKLDTSVIPIQMTSDSFNIKEKTSTIPKLGELYKTEFDESLVQIPKQSFRLDEELITIPELITEQPYDLVTIEEIVPEIPITDVPFGGGGVWFGGLGFDGAPRRRRGGKKFRAEGVNPDIPLGFSREGADAYTISSDPTKDKFLKEFKAGKGTNINKLINLSNIKYYSDQVKGKSKGTSKKRSRKSKSGKRKSSMNDVGDIYSF